MHASKTIADLSSENIAGWSRRAVPICLSVAAISLSLAIVLGVLVGDGFKALSYSYLVSYAFFLSISLGSLFFVVIQHITRAGWSVVIRRLAELTSQGVIPLAVLFLPVLIPVLLGCSPLYEWNHADAVAGDALLQKKTAYLNSGFFAVRWVLYFAVWSLIARQYLAWSRAQDSDGDVVWTERQGRWSGPAAILLALTTTFAAFDLLMSLDAHWFSTIYGIYYFAGSMVAFFAAACLAIAWLRRMGRLRELVGTEHLHDIGKLLFGFNCFWAYIAFSQYLLIWYSNIPEETQWYLRRQQNGWGVISLVLIFGHFAVPFLGMMSREVKRNRAAMTFWSVWLLAMHWIDLYWLAVPQTSPAGPSIGLLDIACFVGCGGLFAAAWLWLAGSCPLVPVRDPRLPESLAFHNI